MRFQKKKAAAREYTVSWDGRLVEPAEEFIAGAGLPEEFCVNFQPCVTGGKTAPSITGLEERFFKRGIVLDLLKVRRMGDGIQARYRVRTRNSPACTPAIPS
jgi:hypothetical protein